MNTNSQSIITDFLKIKDWLGLSEDVALEIEFNHDEGFYYDKKWSEQLGRHRSSVMIGILNGYNRTLLIHECLHGIGMEHEKPPSYRSVVKFDEYSKSLEKEMFNS